MNVEKSTEETVQLPESGRLVAISNAGEAARRKRVDEMGNLRAGGGAARGLTEVEGGKV